MSWRKRQESNDGAWVSKDDPDPPDYASELSPVMLNKLLKVIADLDTVDAAGTCPVKANDNLDDVCFKVRRARKKMPHDRKTINALNSMGERQGLVTDLPPLPNANEHHVDGVPYPANTKGHRCPDGSIMMVLDSGAEVHAGKFAEMIPDEISGKPLNLSSFMGDVTPCERVGNYSGSFVDASGQRLHLQDMGFGGVVTSRRMTDSLLSIPVMVEKGYAFWIGPHPRMITPDGDVVPLHRKSNGYLALRVYPDGSPGTTKVVSCVNAYKVAALFNDENLWHRRMCHTSIRCIRLLYG